MLKNFILHTKSVGRFSKLSESFQRSNCRNASARRRSFSSFRRRCSSFCRSRSSFSRWSFAVVVRSVFLVREENFLKNAFLRSSHDFSHLSNTPTCVVSLLYMLGSKPYSLSLRRSPMSEKLQKRGGDERPTSLLSVHHEAAALVQPSPLPRSTEIRNRRFRGRQARFGICCVAEG